VAALPVEYLRATRIVNEVVDGVEVISFEVPTHKYFSRGEVPYLSLALDVDIRRLESMISDMKYGRVVVEKLWAHRLDSDIAREVRQVLLPDLTMNQVNGEAEELEGVRILKLHVGQLREFIRILVRARHSFKEIVIHRRPPHPAIARYIAYL
jgi:hypothetical protein